jgi:hypothetical protein
MCSERHTTNIVSPVPVVPFDGEKRFTRGDDPREQRTADDRYGSRPATREGSHYGNERGTR